MPPPHLTLSHQTATSIIHRHIYTKEGPARTAPKQSPAPTLVRNLTTSGVRTFVIDTEARRVREYHGTDAAPTTEDDVAQIAL